MRKRLVLGTLTLAAVLAVGSCSDELGPSISERFAASLTGAAERPTPVTTTATGTAEFQILSGVPGIFFRLSVANIDNVTAAHIHGPATTEQPAGVLSGLYAGAATGTGTTGVLAQGVINSASGITFDSLVTLLRSGNAYVNVHTTANPGGEIRGQIARQ